MILFENIRGSLREHPLLIYTSICLGLALAAGMSVHFSTATQADALGFSLLFGHVLAVLCALIVFVYLKSHERLPVLPFLLGASFLLGVATFACCSNELIGENFNTLCLVAHVIREAMLYLLVFILVQITVPYGLSATLIMFGLSAAVQGTCQFLLGCFMPVPRMIVYSVLPLLAALFYPWACKYAQEYTSAHLKPGEPANTLAKQPESQQQASISKAALILLAAVIFCMALIGGHIVYDLLANQETLMDSFTLQASSALGNILGGLWILAYARAEKPTPVLITTLILVLAINAAAFYLISFTDGLVSICVNLILMTIVMQISRAICIYIAFEAVFYGVQLLPAFALASGIWSLARTVTSIFGMLTASGESDIYDIAVMISLFILIAAIIFMANEQLKNSDFSAGQSAAGKPKPQAAESITPFKTAIEEISAEYNFTDRERKTLVYLAQGRNAESIAKAMTLSTNTVKSHMKNLYNKMGIHSQQDLIDTVNTRVESIRNNAS